MALILEETLEDGRVLAYHRAAEFRITASPPIVTFTLESFEDAASRADPTVTPYRREWDFPFFGVHDIPTEAYQALLATPGWESATADASETDPNLDPGAFAAKPAGTATWDATAGDWVDPNAEDLDVVASAKLVELSKSLAVSQIMAIYSGGEHWACDASAQARLMRTAFLAAQAPDLGAFTRPWLRDERGPGADPAEPPIGSAVTLDGTQLLQLVADLEARQTAAIEHHEAKRADVMTAYAITPAEDAIAAIKAITWEFDGYTWGMP